MHRSLIQSASSHRKAIFVILCFSFTALLTHTGFRFARVSPIREPQSLSNLLLPIPQTAVTGTLPWIPQNHRTLRNMFRCIERGDCRQNQTKVILLSSMFFRLEMLGETSGEEIWARSIVQGLTNMGYTLLYTKNMEQTIQLYQIIPAFVKVILADDIDSEWCSNPIYDCAQSQDNPAGIPQWKIFTVSFWSHPNNPLGAKWTLSPEDYQRIGLGQNTYVGYSVQETCRKTLFVPHSERPNQAYILAKLLSFFTPERDASWTPAIFDMATKATGITYVLGSFNDTLQGEWPAARLPTHYVNHGLGTNDRSQQRTFLERLSKAKVLIGMGNPRISPTPYDALCLGIPFINPITNWDRTNSSDKSKWDSQHPPLSRLDPPYVYNVVVGDSAGFVEAIRAAIANPIDSFTLEEMRMASLEKRLAEIVEHDWKAEAEAAQIV